MNSQHWMMYFLFAAMLALATARAHAVQAPYANSGAPFVLHQVPGNYTYYVPAQTGAPGVDKEGHTSHAGVAVTARGVAVYDAPGFSDPEYRRPTANSTRLTPHDQASSTCRTIVSQCV